MSERDKMITEKRFDTGKLTINYAEGLANGSLLVLLHGGIAQACRRR
jgi:hypothetical protein